MVDAEAMGHRNDGIAMALHLSRGFDSPEGVTSACRFFYLDAASTAEVLDIWRDRQGQAIHPGRKCSPDCAEYGCTSWTAATT